MCSPLVSWVSGALSSPPHWARYRLIHVLLCLYNVLFSPQIKTFGALVKGNGTLLDEYVALVDGVFLNEVMFQM